MPFHLSLCPVHVSIHTTSDGKASMETHGETSVSPVCSSVRLDVLDFHLDSTSNSVHSCNLSISRCSIPRHATHYLDAIAKSQTKPKPLLMKRKISLAPPHPPVGKQTQPPRRIPQYFPLALVKSQSPPSIQTEAPTTRAKPNKRRFRLRPRRNGGACRWHCQRQRAPKGNRAAYRPPPSCWMFLKSPCAVFTVNGRDGSPIVFTVNVAVPPCRSGSTVNSWCSPDATLSYGGLNKSQDRKPLRGFYSSWAELYFFLEKHSD